MKLLILSPSIALANAVAFKYDCRVDDRQWQFMGALKAQRIGEAAAKIEGEWLG